MTDTQKQALQYLAQAVSDYANTLPPSVRGPFVNECKVAIQILETEPEKSAAP